MYNASVWRLSTSTNSKLGNIKNVNKLFCNIINRFSTANLLNKNENVFQATKAI